MQPAPASSTCFHHETAAIGQASSQNGPLPFHSADPPTEAPGDNMGVGLMCYAARSADQRKASPLVQSSLRCEPRSVSVLAALSTASPCPWPSGPSAKLQMEHWMVSPELDSGLEPAFRWYRSLSMCL